jgi:hypothetical protein
MSLPANQQNQATAKSLPACESVGQSPLEQFKSSLLRPLCFGRTINDDHYTLGTCNCLLGHAPAKYHPKNKYSRLDAKLQTHSDRQWPQVQISIPVANLLSQGQYHQTTGLQFTITHCERANQHPSARLQGEPTLAGIYH